MDWIVPTYLTLPWPSVKIKFLGQMFGPSISEKGKFKTPLDQIDKMKLVLSMNLSSLSVRFQLLTNDHSTAPSKGKHISKKKPFLHTGTHLPSHTIYHKLQRRDDTTSTH